MRVVQKTGRSTKTAKAPKTGRRMLAALTLMMLGAAAPSYAQSQPGIGPAIDFNNDGLADIADHHLPSGQFWVRLNLGGGVFQAPGTSWGPVGSPGVTSSPASTWTIRIGDFNGDGLGDYVDIHPASGQFWYHVGTGSMTWSASSTAGSGLQVGPDWEVFVARAYLNDRYTEFIEHNRATGALKVWWNWNGALVPLFAPGSWSSTVGTDWRLLVGDFDGDGLADVADNHIPSGQFWIHRNLGNGNFDATAWAMATANPSFTTIVGDFNGDGLTDYADLNKTTGQFYIHRNFGGGVFDPAITGTGQYSTSSGFSVMGTPIVF